MKPSVGRTVHYRVAEDICYAAIITHVETDTWYDQDTNEATEYETVSLNIMPPMREIYQRVALQGEKLGMWHWPERVE